MSLSAAQIARNRLASKRRSDPAADVTDLRRDLAAVALEERIRKIVAEAPPFTEEQKARLRVLLNCGR
jgi:hypothetical protein